MPKRKIFCSLFAFSIASFMIISACQAGLINYDRRNKRLGTETTVTSTPARTQTSKATGYNRAPMPDWMSKAQKVRNRNERRFDTNKNGMLEASEVKAYLRSVIKQVDQKGGFRINSNILNAYDANRDGVINRYEIAELRKHAR